MSPYRRVEHRSAEDEAMRRWKLGTRIVVLERERAVLRARLNLYAIVIGVQAAVMIAGAVVVLVTR